MLLQTFNPYKASLDNKKSHFIFRSMNLHRQVMIVPNAHKSFSRWLPGTLRVALIGALAISGCTLENSGDKSEKQGKLNSQENVELSAKPVHREAGEASWYGPGFHGKETANGETFNKNELTAAHPTLPMGAKAKVTNLDNGKKVDVRINDRGPFTGGRAIDLSSAAANKLDMKKGGTTDVKIESKPTKKKSSKNKHGKPKQQ